MFFGEEKNGEMKKNLQTVTLLIAQKMEAKNTRDCLKNYNSRLL